MADYEDREHMSLVSADTTENAQEICILPHQPVVRLDSLTTKLRVVFDASARTSNGTTLNDKLMMGPNLQNELFHIILRFRAHQIAITADIEAMYRQILVAQEDRNLQRVLWRSESTQPIKTYCLNTLTYGTAPAPYLAIRCLRELAEQETEYQEAAEVLKRDFYMDDLSSRASTVEKAIALQKQLFNLLQKGQFNLRKWRCNKEEVLEHLKEEQEEKGLLQLNKERALKTLGLLWDAKADTVKYTVDIGEETEVTRRIIVSREAQIFDPLGLLGPVLINGKCIMQQTWLAPVGWDDELPEELQKSWNRYYSSLQSINEFEIPRNVNPGNATEKFDIFGFGDASEKACGACLYAVSQDKDGNKKSSLIFAKNKVAPVKTISLPRLELDAALMLSELCSTAQQAYGNKVQKIYLWSDSTIVLHQIATSPNLLKTFVANRVTRIQNLTQNATWLHVPSSDNPADVLSRGLAVDEWKKNTLWWHGPDWIHTEEGWPAQPLLQKSIPDQLELKTIVAVAAVKFDASILRKYSSYDKLVRVIAYCLRFKFRTLKTNKIEAQEEADGRLSIHELRQAEIVIIRLTQTEVFSTEQHMIRDGKPIPRDSRLAALNPSLDQDGLLIVGGRLRHAQIPEAQKHQIILPSKHPVTTLIMRKEHERLLHCGSEQLLYSVRQQFWPLSGRREALKITRNCVKCFRLKPRSREVLMGDLPRVRVRGTLRPFINTGVDYAGPFQIRESRRRGRVHISKAWIAVFVCCATKAVHLELVTELSTEAFLGALRRFISRRGICSTIASDNGTNFVSAARQLKELYEFLETEEEGISAYLIKQKIESKFIPPRTPNFGGLWEAAVKSAKKHLYAVTQGLVLTFGEFYTLLVEIESVLNSRPLIPMSSDPNDLSASTPAHFLVGEPFLFPVETCHQNTPDNRLAKWHLIQKVRQHFWTRWHHEYLQELQRRHKWVSRRENLKPGMLVLIKEDNVPPLQWALGRIVEVFPGADDTVRVITLKTPSGLFKRAACNICPLPLDDE